MNEACHWAKTLLDALEPRICLVDEAGVIVAVNRSWAESARENGNASRAGVPGQSYFSACEEAAASDEGAVAEAAGLRAVLAGELPRFSLEYPCEAPEGRRWAEVTVTRISREGAVLAAVVHSDVTGRRRAQEALEESERRFRTLVESVPNVAVQGYDRDRRVVFWNDASEALYGYTREEAVGSRLEELIIPDAMKAGVVEAVDAWVNRGVAVPPGELVLRKKDGSPVSVFSSHVLLVDSRGEKEMHCIDVDLTKRREAESELRQRQSELAAARRHAQVGSWEVDLVTGRVVWSDEVYRIFGRDPSQPPPPLERLAELCAPGSRGLFEEALQAGIAGGTPAECELEVLRPDGTTRAVAVLGEPRRDAEGRLTGLGGTLLDVTERKLTEALRRSEEKFGKAFHSNPSPMALSSWPERRFLEVNDAFVRKLGYAREEVVGRTPAELGFFASPEQARELGRLIGRQAVVENFEMEVRVRDGSVRHGLFSADLLSLQGDHVLLTVMIDATGRRSAEKEVERYRLRLEELVRERTAELAEANRGLEREMARGRLAREALAAREAHYRLLFESSPLPMWVVEIESLAFLQVNEAALRHYGYSQEEFLSMTLRDIRPPEDLPVFDLAVNRHETGLRHPGIFRHRRHDGSLIDVEITTHEISVGGRRARLVLAKDVTEQHRAETEIRRLNHELEERVRQRTAQLEEANRELEAFSYSVSHDLRSPLRAVDGYTELLGEHLDGSLDGEGRRLLEGIRGGARRMEKLISGLLSLSKASRGAVRSVPVDMNRLAEEALAEAIPPMQRERVRVVSFHLPPVHGDPDLLRQVLQNLVSNAVKFSSRKDAPVIELGGRVREGRNEYFVRDNGAGFDARLAERLFGTFQRLHSEKEFEGTGIGLSLVRRIVERHGGSAWAEGSTGEGATFWFTLGSGDGT